MSMATALIFALFVFFYVLLARWHWELDGESDRNRQAVASLRGDLGNLVRRLDSLDRTAGQAASHDAALWREIDKASAAREGLAERITTVQTDTGCLRNTAEYLDGRIAALESLRIGDSIVSLDNRIQQRLAVAEAQRKDLNSNSRHIEQISDRVEDLGNDLEDLKRGLGKALGFEPVGEPQ